MLNNMFHASVLFHFGLGKQCFNISLHHEPVHLQYFNFIMYDS